MLISPYWDAQLMLEDNEKPHVLAIGVSWFWYPLNNLLNPIILHNHDRAIPTGKGFASLGNWLKEPMNRANVNQSLQQDIVNRLPLKFTQRLKARRTRSSQITFVDSARLADIAQSDDIGGKGTLTGTEWAHELRPMPRGSTSSCVRAGGPHSRRRGYDSRNQIVHAESKLSGKGILTVLHS